MNKTLILFLVLLSLTKLTYGQKKDYLYLSILCNENNISKNHSVLFILKFMNYGEDSVTIPNRIVSGPRSVLSVNLGFELLRITGKDTIDVLETQSEDIDPFGLPYINVYKLPPQSSRLIEVHIEKDFFDEKGIYLVRFVLKKNLLLEKSLKFNNDIYSNWKIVNIN